MIATLGKWIVWTCLFLLGFATSGAADEKPTVILYTKAGCRPCRQALESLRELGIEPTVSRDCPAWVQQVPVIHWRDSAGVWRQHAPQHWSGWNWSEAETEKLRRWLLIDSATKSTARDPYLLVTALDNPFDVTAAERELETLCKTEGVDLDALAQAAGANFDSVLLGCSRLTTQAAPLESDVSWFFPVAGRPVMRIKHDG